MVGRIYRLRRKNRVNYFEPADYEAAASKIIRAFASNTIQMAEIETDDTSISPFIIEVLKLNGYTPEKIEFFSRRIKYKFSNRATRDDVVTLLQLMKNDFIKEVDFETYSYPVGMSKNGIRVPLVGYTKEQADRGDRGTSSLNTPTGGESSSEITEESSPNWLLIGGIAVVGVIALLAVIKMIKK